MPTQGGRTFFVKAVNDLEDWVITEEQKLSDFKEVSSALQRKNKP